MSERTSKEAMVYVKVEPNRKADENGIIPFFINFDNKDDVEIARNMAKSILDWIERNENLTKS